jgi:hypothetical protein
MKDSGTHGPFDLGHAVVFNTWLPFANGSAHSSLLDAPAHLTTAPAPAEAVASGRVRTGQRLAGWGVAI